MEHQLISRRAFTAGLALQVLPAQSTEWQNLFDGKTLSGWTASENKSSWKVDDGCLLGDGQRSHLYYSGPVQNADFHNFELEVECFTMPACNSGVYFHTKYQETNFPNKGFEVQVNNSATGANNYRERKRTASLYGFRNVYKQLALDEKWFKMQVVVRGNNVQIRLDNMLVVDYTQTTPPYIPKGHETERFLDHGTFALQCHDGGSKIRFRNIRVRPLPDNPSAGSTAAPDQAFRDIIDLSRNNYPLVDFDIQLKGGLTLEAALSESRKNGFARAVSVAAGKGQTIHDEASAQRFLNSMKGHPVFFGLRTSGEGIASPVSRETIAKFDYILADARGWSGKLDFDAMLAKTTAIFEAQPIDIVANLPMQADWGDERMEKLLTVLAKNSVALQINERGRQPGAAVLKMAKKMGVKFSFGSGAESAAGLNRFPYTIAMIKECLLGERDFFVPGGLIPRAIERTGR